MTADLSRLPAVDRVLKGATAQALVERYGRTLAVEAVRTALADLRTAKAVADEDGVATLAADKLAARMAPSQRPMFNLTGTVLHTNLGRALLAEAAIAAMAEVLGRPSNLEFDVADGRRGERDDHVRTWLRQLTGAEDATVVNNNAAAVVLLLNSLALGKAVPVSRGELIEIGGAFRVPDIMARAGCRLVEVGTTNRTHLRDFEAAIGPETAMLMKVHPSNYAVVGFTHSVPEAELAALAHKHGLPFANDLGSGQLVDLERWGLPHEPTPREALQAGADLVTFSGDKLLGGPQCGIVVGRKDLIQKLNKNPLKRALRLDKGRLAALEATLRLYADPDRLAERLPTLRLLTRPAAEIDAVAHRLLPAMTRALTGQAEVAVEACRSQIGSGALPVDLLPSHCLSIKATGTRSGAAVERLAAAFRALPMPVVGRIEDGCLKLDLRCLEDEAAFIAQLAHLKMPGGA
ncbi:L-seryl-tRNA(Sec) selenium transferase [Vineibacter terrae]|uniref:L-seryl-tRNA(Sec) selenium transferase n=1 Tax=Vineibacter terrae TaxID=2586908 RepID=A0A5C8PT77_9HYPH|nr:L-seryl-tRNA(Sec) selenium transferase [Vineibacter terrae]TXL79448.1 L-seryl-tRNA(Sec) selenium transferase [Vineibacter terrae]